MDADIADTQNLLTVVLLVATGLSCHISGHIDDNATDPTRLLSLLCIYFSRFRMFGEVTEGSMTESH